MVKFSLDNNEIPVFNLHSCGRKVRHSGATFWGENTKLLAVCLYKNA